MQRLHASFRTLALGAAALALLPLPAAAKTRTKVVSCAAGDCLLVTGRRAHAALPVAINGHAVAVSGQRRWRALVPVATVRDWSAPYARSIRVAVGGTSGDAAAETRDVRLPIGLLGHTVDLAQLVIRAK